MKFLKSFLLFCLTLSASATDQELRLYPLVTPPILNFVKTCEGFVASAQNCPGGHATIGYGHLIKQEDPVLDAIMSQNTTGIITEEEATELLTMDLVSHFNPLYPYLEEAPIHVTHGFMSLSFNIGSHNLVRRNGSFDSSLQAYREDKSIGYVMNQVCSWRSANKSYFKGMLARRIAEASIIGEYRDAREAYNNVIGELEENYLNDKAVSTKLDITEVLGLAQTKLDAYWNV